MTYTPQSPIAGGTRGIPDDWIRWAEQQGAHRLDDVELYIHTIYEFAPKVGLAAHKIIAQSVHETSDAHPKTGRYIPWTSEAWTACVNPAGIGVTREEERTWHDFGNGRNAALAHLVRLCKYVYGPVPEILAPYAHLDPRGPVPASVYGQKQTLASFGNANWRDVPTWAAKDEYGQLWADTLNRIEPVFAGETTGETPMAKPYILIVAGHRSTGDPGNPTERARTDELAEAYTRAFREAGFRADWLQRDLDNDSDPTMTLGNLTTVALLCRDVIARAPEELVIMLDLHFDGAHSRVHAVVPDNIGLKAAFSGGAPASDTAANNTLDVALAATITTLIAEDNDLPLYHGRLGVPGAFSERDTYVASAGQGGWRLGMFAATAVHRMKAVRLVIEHAGYNDANTKKPGFEERCARAAVEGVMAVLKLTPDAPDEPEVPSKPDPQPNPDIAYPAGMDTGIAAMLFGEVVGDDQRQYAYDEHGPVSQLWLERGKASSQFPELVQVRIFDERKYFVFSDGSVIWHPNVREPVRILGVVDRAVDTITKIVDRNLGG